MGDKTTVSIASRASFVLLVLLVLFIPLFAQGSCASNTNLQPTQLFTEVTSKTGIAQASLTYENFSTSPPRKPVNYAPLVVHIYNDTWDGSVVRFYTNFEGDAALDLNKYVPSTEGGCYSVDFIFCSPYEYDLWQCLESGGISSTLLQPYFDSATSSGVVNSKMYAIAHIPSDLTLFSDSLKPWIAGQLSSEGYSQMAPLNLKTISDTQQYCPIPEKPAAPSLGFCFPLILIFALLGAGMFMKGQNPFGGFDFSTPRMGKMHARYGGARGRGAFFDVAGAYSSVKGAIAEGKSDLGAIKEEKSFWKASGKTFKSDLKASYAGITASKKDLADAKKSDASASVASAAMAKLGLSGGGGRRKLQLFGLERVTGADGIVARARTMRSNIEGVKKQSESQVGGFKQVFGTIAASVIGRTELGLVRSEEKLKQDFTSHKGGVAGAIKDVSALFGELKTPIFSLEDTSKSKESGLLGVDMKLNVDDKVGSLLGIKNDAKAPTYSLTNKKLDDGGALKEMAFNPMFKPLFMLNVQVVRDGMQFSLGSKIDVYGKFDSKGNLIVQDGRSGEEVTLYKRDENGNLVFNKGAVKKGWDEGKAAKALGAIDEKAASAMHTLLIDARERQKDAGEKFVSAASETGGLLENLKKTVGKLKDDVHTAEDAAISARPLARLLEKVDSNKDKLSNLEAEQKSVESRLKQKGLSIEEKSELKAHSLVVAAEISSAKITVAGDDNDLKRFGGYNAVKATVTATSLNYNLAQEKLAETKSLISGFETGSMLNDPALLKKVITGEVPASQEIRKAAVEYLATGAIVEVAESRARPLVMFSRDLQDGHSTSESLTASADALQSFNSTQARAASAVVAYENAETMRGAVGIMEKATVSMSGPQKEKAEKDIKTAKESTSALSANAIGELYAASAVGQRTGLASQVALEHYLFAKESATSRSVGELMTDKEKEIVAAKKPNLQQHWHFLLQSPISRSRTPVKLDGFKYIDDIQRSMPNLKENEGNLALEAAKASFESGALGHISEHLESATEGLRELKREGKEGSAPVRLEKGLETAQATFVGLREAKTLDAAMEKAGAADIGVQLASLGGKSVCLFHRFSLILREWQNYGHRWTLLKSKCMNLLRKSLSWKRRLLERRSGSLMQGGLRLLRKNQRKNYPKAKEKNWLFCALRVNYRPFPTSKKRLKLMSKLPAGTMKPIKLLTMLLWMS